MANTQVNVTQNGTTTLATAGKYCDRNIDVNVSVPTNEPTQFVNVLEYAVLEINTRYSNNGTVNSNQPNSIIGVTIDLNSLPSGVTLQKNTNEFRFRGCCHPDGAFAQSADGTTWTAKGWSTTYSRVDEHHDMVFTRGYISERYVRFNIGMSTYPTSSNTALPADFDPVAAGCIVTFNQPIGNAGYVG